jgi:hypothetical protein
VLSRIRSRLTYANVVATLALFIALGGSAYAVAIPANSVGTNQLKFHAVTNSKLAFGAVQSYNLGRRAVWAANLGAGAVMRINLNRAVVTSTAMAPGAVTSAALANWSVTNAALAPGSVTSVDLAPGAVTAAPIAKLQIVTGPGMSSPGSPSSPVLNTATATCPSGMYVVGGGTRVSDELNQFTNDSYPSGNAGWTTNVFNAASGERPFNAYAICAPAAAALSGP